MLFEPGLVWKHGLYRCSDEVSCISFDATSVLILLHPMRSDQPSRLILIKLAELFGDELERNALRPAALVA